MFGTKPEMDEITIIAGRLGQSAQGIPINRREGNPWGFRSRRLLFGGRGCLVRLGFDQRRLCQSGTMSQASRREGSRSV